VGLSHFDRSLDQIAKRPGNLLSFHQTGDIVPDVLWGLSDDVGQAFRPHQPIHYLLLVFHVRCALLSDAQIVFQNATLQMLEFAGVLRRLGRWFVLPAALSVKSAIPDNSSYQE
jgi:hypothetical protein